MADEMRHTPTPWEHTGGDVWVDTREQVCCGRGAIECCGVPDVIGGQELVARASPADAAFIVRAVNSYARALNAECECERLREALEKIAARPYPATSQQNAVEHYQALLEEWGETKRIVSTALSEKPQ